MKKIILIVIVVISLTPITVFGYGYGIPKESTNIRPYPGDEYHNTITNNNGIYLAEDTNKVYLTFDNGYENGYTKDMIDILYNNDVVGVFFITGHYLKENSELVKYMLEKNQLVANHSYSHKDFQKLSKEEIQSDIKKLEDLYKEVTDEEFTMFFRPPEGTFNNDSLKIVDDLGYTNLFWSIAYKDWERDVTRGVDYTINSIIPRLHNGAIILLHTVSKDNCLALDTLIKQIKLNDYIIDNPINLIN
ncbi:MAG: polysaccharide deacetylase family protein [bacterium]